MLYGLTSCDSCRKARKWLDTHAIDYGFHDLRGDGLDIQTLERWADCIEWEKLMNTRSLTWRKLPEVDRADMTRERALAAMLDHPTLVKRPVIEQGKVLAVGFSRDQYAEIFKNL